MIVNKIVNYQIVNYQISSFINNFYWDQVNIEIDDQVTNRVKDQVYTQIFRPLWRQIDVQAKGLVNVQIRKELDDR